MKRIERKRQALFFFKKKKTKHTIFSLSCEHLLTERFGDSRCQVRVQ